MGVSLVWRARACVAPTDWSLATRRGPHKDGGAQVLIGRDA